MATRVEQLLQSSWNEEHGVFDVRAAVDALVRSTDEPFDELLHAFRQSEVQWRLPILEAMRAIAATQQTEVGQAASLIEATEEIAPQAGFDEYYKTINAIAAAPQGREALTRYVGHLMSASDEPARGRLVEYILAVLKTKLRDDKASVEQRFGDYVNLTKSEALRRQLQDFLSRG